MTYRGHIKDGRIALDEPANLTEGAKVYVQVIEPAAPHPTIWEKLLSIAGTVEGPEDWARNHDHYVHGSPKRP